MLYIAFLQNRQSSDKFTLTSSQEEATKLAQIASKSVGDHANKIHFEETETNDGGVPSILRGKYQKFIKNTITLVLNNKIPQKDARIITMSFIVEIMKYWQQFAH